MLSVRHLVFLEAAKQLSFSKASQALFISQPAISKHIQALEQQYQIKLFERKGIQLELTSAGNLLYQRLLEVKQIQDSTAYELSAMHDISKAKGQLKLGASTTVALYILPAILSGFHRSFPETEISLLNRNSESVLEALLKKDINLGIIEDKGKRTNIEYAPFITDKVVAVCSSHSKLLKKKTYFIEELQTLPIALRERGSGTLAILKQTLEKEKIKLTSLNVKVRLGGTEALKNFLMASDCLGFLPKRSVQKELNHGELKEITIDKLHLERQFFFIQRKGEQSDMNKNFIRFAQNNYNYTL